jgi:hypothetical protein
MKILFLNIHIKLKIKLLELRYLNNVLHVGPAEVHGPAIDVVQHQLHVITLR